MYIGYNKPKTVLKRPFQLDAHFIPEEPYCTFSASARVLFHSGMFRKQINMAGCLARPFTVSFIVDLEAKVPINGELISLKEFILMIPWPLVPARDECNRPCMLDKEGNMVTNDNDKVMGYPVDPVTGLRTGTDGLPTPQFAHQLRELGAEIDMVETPEPEGVEVKALVRSVIEQFETQLRGVCQIESSLPQVVSPR